MNAWTGTPRTPTHDGTGGHPGEDGEGGEGAAEPEQVVLLDDVGRAIGTHPKATVHHRQTPLHLAISCHVFDRDGRVLLTRRALGKPTWPGVWTNGCCGHPAPGEALADTVRRRARHELGISLSELRLLLPTFSYRAVMADGVVEHEMCPVFVAVAADAVRPSPDEVDDHRWLAWGDLRTRVLDGGLEVSPWCRQQVAELPEHPLRTAEADPSLLPPAARPGAT